MLERGFLSKLGDPCKIPGVPFSNCPPKNTAIGPSGSLFVAPIRFGSGKAFGPAVAKAWLGRSWWVLLLFLVDMLILMSNVYVNCPVSHFSSFVLVLNVQSRAAISLFFFFRISSNAKGWTVSLQKVE